MVQQEQFGDNLKRWLAKAKGAATSDATLTLGSLAAAAIFSTAVTTTPSDADAWGQVLDGLKNVGLGIVANALPTLLERIGKREGKVTYNLVSICRPIAPTATPTRVSYDAGLRVVGSRVLMPPGAAVLSRTG